MDSPSCFAFGGTTKYLSDFCEGEFSRWPQRGKPEHTCAQNVDVRGERATIQKTGEYHFAQVIEVGVADDLRAHERSNDGRGGNIHKLWKRTAAVCCFRCRRTALRSLRGLLVV